MHSLVHADSAALEILANRSAPTLRERIKLPNLLSVALYNIPDVLLVPRTFGGRLVDFVVLPDTVRQLTLNTTDLRRKDLYVGLVSSRSLHKVAVHGGRYDIHLDVDCLDVISYVSPDSLPGHR